MPVVFRIARMCRYDAPANRWERLPPPDLFRRLVPLPPEEAGKGLCNDIDFGAAPPGQVVARVPSADRAEARFVPQPADACPR